MLEKTLESPLDCKEIQRVHPKEDQFTVFIGRTSIEAETAVLGPPDARRPERDFQVKKTPWGKNIATHSSTSALKKISQRSLANYTAWEPQESDTT